MPVPSGRWWFLSAVAVGAGALAIRQFVPVGVNVFGLQLAYFSSYIFLFALGIAAWRHDWLRQLSWQQVRPWVWGLLLTWPSLLIGVEVIRHAGLSTDTARGLSWASLLYAMWEPFIAWGLIGAWLLGFRARMNQPSPFWDWLNRRAYAVYILHPPVLVGIALLLHGWVAPALIKFAVVGCLTCIATWLVSDPFVRVPGVRSVV